MKSKKKKIQWGINTLAVHLNMRKCAGLPPMKDEEFREFCRTHRSFIPCKELKRKMKKTKKVVEEKNLIEASKIQPGMIIGIKRRGDKYDDIVLILAKTGFTDVDYKFLDYQDAYGSIMCSGIKGKELVKVITGKRKKHIFEHIQKDVFKYHSDVEDLIDTLRLIEAMDKSLR
jgi:hypothetical protein